MLLYEKIDVGCETTVESDEYEEEYVICGALVVSFGVGIVRSYIGVGDIKK